MYRMLLLGYPIWLCPDQKVFQAEVDRSLKAKRQEQQAGEPSRLQEILNRPPPSPAVLPKTNSKLTFAPSPKPDKRAGPSRPDGRAPLPSQGSGEMRSAMKGGARPTQAPQARGQPQGQQKPAQGQARPPQAQQKPAQGQQRPPQGQQKPTQAQPPRQAPPPSSGPGAARPGQGPRL